jgi:rod shape-determining protein MreD
MTSTLDIDVVTIVIVYLMGCRFEIGAGFFALGQGLLLDIFSGGIWGFNVMLYLIVYLFIKMVSRPFDLFSVFGQVVVVLLGVLAKDVLIVLLLHLFSLNNEFSIFDFLHLIVTVLCSGLMAPVIFLLLNSLGRFFLERAKIFQI